MKKFNHELDSMEDENILKVCNYLLSHAEENPQFQQVLDKPNKTIKGMWEFIVYTAQKQLHEKQQYCCVSDETVYDWAVEYYTCEETAQEVEERQKQEEIKKREEEYEKSKAKREEETKRIESLKNENYLKIEAVKEKLKNNEVVDYEEIRLLNNDSKKKERKSYVIDGQASLF